MAPVVISDYSLRSRRLTTSGEKPTGIRSLRKSPPASPLASLSKRGCRMDLSLILSYEPPPPALTNHINSAEQIKPAEASKTLLPPPPLPSRSALYRPLPPLAPRRAVPPMTAGEPMAVYPPHPSTVSNSHGSLSLGVLPLSGSKSTYLPNASTQLPSVSCQVQLPSKRKADADASSSKPNKRQRGEKSKDEGGIKLPAEKKLVVKLPVRKEFLQSFQLESMSEEEISLFGPVRVEQLKQVVRQMVEANIDILSADNRREQLSLALRRGLIAQSRKGQTFNPQDINLNSYGMTMGDLQTKVFDVVHQEYQGRTLASSPPRQQQWAAVNGSSSSAGVGGTHKGREAPTSSSSSGSSPSRSKKGDAKCKRAAQTMPPVPAGPAQESTEYVLGHKDKEMQEAKCPKAVEVDESAGNETKKRAKTKATKTTGGKARVFVCDDPTCGESFTRQEHLNRHINSGKHLARKVFTCDHCAKTFTRKDNLQQHQKTKGCQPKKSPTANSEAEQQTSSTVSA